MSLYRTLAIFVRQVFLFKSNPTRLVSIFLWLIIDIIQWGFISRYLGSLGQATFSFITVILGAIILWEFMARIEQGIMMAFLEDIWSQNFINFFASPLKVREYLGGLILTSITSGAAAFVGIAMGIFVSGIIFRLGPSAEWLGWPIPMVLSIFSGVYYPISTLPPYLQVFARVIPPAYVFESCRAVLATGNLPAGYAFDLAAGALIAAAYLAATSLFFVRVYRRNLESGSISRFNAEAL